MHSHRQHSSTPALSRPHRAFDLGHARLFPQFDYLALSIGEHFCCRRNKNRQHKAKRAEDNFGKRIHVSMVVICISFPNTFFLLQHLKPRTQIRATRAAIIFRCQSIVLPGLLRVQWQRIEEAQVVYRCRDDWNVVKKWLRVCGS